MADSIEEQMAKLMKPGVRVVRGKDWDWYDQDGNGPGTVIRMEASDPFKNWWKIEWDDKSKPQRIYKMGAGKYDLKIIGYERQPTKDCLGSVEQQPTKECLGSVMLNTKKFMDFKIICEDKTFECHKAVLSSQSDVFDAMFTNMNMNEANSGEVEIEDFKADAIETMIDFLYKQEIKDDLINTQLLLAADKYNIKKLMKLCCQKLKMKLSIENALDILLCADLTNQQDLINAASEFLRKNAGKLVKTSFWIQKEKTNPKLINDLFSKAFLK